MGGMVLFVISCYEEDEHPETDRLLE
jgi:hypothetical protein